ncbi:uncharacterized protein LOC126676340 [Mercurialis annua]|uniref:uncharacterized protein LOC126676340 n=1 Tax=Mercurialis annua TaxID=3986 RepID=UPI00215FA4A8|nr:uncharacterized protein LOC126676340 [Mercurialis annua]XP_050226479.1 uncharacterized protein LOC126676340 [Mercurialis annua]
MIKRRFFREEHGDKDEPSSGSSSSSDDDEDNVNDNDSEAEPEPEAEESDDSAQVAEVKANYVSSSSSSSGYDSEDRSAEEIDVDSSGFTNEDDGTGSDKEIRVGSGLSGKHNAHLLKKKFNIMAEKESDPAEMEDFVLKFKSVFKCRICPRILCLTEESMKTHINSKRHSRSEKLLKENRLKAMLNSDGEIENQETPAEMHARIMAIAQSKPKKPNKGRQRQNKRSRKRKEKDVSNTEKAKEPTKTKAKKKRKADD